MVMKQAVGLHEYFIIFMIIVYTGIPEAALVIRQIEEFTYM